MQLDGIHHITCITADARGNFDAPDVYHLYYGDERGAPG
jgi:hypothetical protein